MPKFAMNRNIPKWRILSGLMLCLSCSWPARADDWPRWRGPEGKAVSEETQIPVRWSTRENILWKVSISGEGFSSPVIWGNRIFLTSAEEKGKRRLVWCLDRESGQILWRREIKHDHPERASAMTGHAAATPVTDGRRVVAMFGNAGVVCHDMAGKLLWHQTLGEFDTELGLASSPVLYRDKIFVVCDHDGDRFTSFDSFLVALDLENGQVWWKSERPGLGRSWSTPVLVRDSAGRRQLIVSAQDQVRAYDPETGKQVWRIAGTTGWVAPSPVFGFGMIFVTSGKDGPTMAIQAGDSAGKVQPKVIWQIPRGGPYVCSPLLYEDFLYVLTEQGILSSYQARTGQLQYRERLEGKFYASPVAGAGKLYFSNDAGTTFVLKAGPKFKVLAQNALEEYCLASPAISAGQLFLRTEHHLYCIGANNKR
jgi:outer membrane protein assembly factor BamB